MVHGSPFLPKIRFSIDEAFLEMERDMLTPWVFLGTGRPLRITNCRGRTVAYEGVKFEGTPRDVFWTGFFQPCIQAEIVRQLDTVLEDCRQAQFFEPGPPVEAAGYLRTKITRFFNRMADIDQRLRGDGYPHNVDRKDVAAEISAMNEFIDSHLEATQRLLTYARPSWWQRNRWWLSAVIAAAIGSIPGLVSLAG